MDEKDLKYNSDYVVTSLLDYLKTQCKNESCNYTVTNIIDILEDAKRRIMNMSVTKFEGVGKGIRNDSNG